jgi:hypothetical protein
MIVPVYGANPHHIFTSVSEQLNILDSISKKIKKNISETITISDTIINKVKKNPSESITISDSVTTKANHLINISELLTLSSTQTTKTLYKANSVDNIGFTDSVSLQAHHYISLSELSTIGDYENKNTGLNLSENTTFEDISQTLIKRDIIIYDDLSINDELFLQTSHNVDLYETVGVTDETLVTHHIYNNIIESMMLLDISQSTTKRSVMIYDDMGVSDEVNSGKQTSVDLEEVFNLTDNTDKSVQFTIELQDQLGVSDHVNITSSKVYNIDLNETVNVLDDLTVNSINSYQVDLIEEIGLIDGVTNSISLTNSVTNLDDGISVGDSLTTQLTIFTPGNQTINLYETIVVTDNIDINGTIIQQKITPTHTPDYPTVQHPSFSKYDSNVEINGVYFSIPQYTTTISNNMTGNNTMTFKIYTDGEPMVHAVMYFIPKDLDLTTVNNISSIQSVENHTSSVYWYVTFKVPGNDNNILVRVWNDKRMSTDIHLLFIPEIKESIQLNNEVYHCTGGVCTK